MSDNTHISWTNSTWNFATGCTKVSPGCKNCYMYRDYPRLKAMGQPSYQKIPSMVTLVPGQLTKPLHWKRPRLIFPCSMSDIGHPLIPDSLLVQAYAVMALTPQHTYQILTKRPRNLPGEPGEHLPEELVQEPGSTFVSSPSGRNPGWLWGEVIKGEADEIRRQFAHMRLPEYDGHWPLKNVWLGVSVEDQDYAWRIDDLARIPAVVHWVSYEPALGPLDLNPYIWGNCQQWGGGTDGRVLDWVVYGGESGPEARPPEVDWFRNIRDQCVDAGVPQHFKGWGNWLPQDQCAPGQFERAKERYWLEGSGWAYTTKKAAGNRLDGSQWLEWPEEMIAA